MIAAARHWAGGGAPSLSEAVADAESLGLPAQLIADLQAADEKASRGFEVWPVNSAIVDTFLSVATQWRTTALADGRMLWIGLDYTAVRARMGDLTPARWAGLGVIERTASTVLNGGN